MSEWIGNAAAKLQGMETAPYVMLVLFAAVFTAVFFIAAYQKLRQYRIVSDTPTSRIRSAPQGYVELKGRLAPLAPDDPIRAPFSGRPCLWYRAWIEEERETNDDKKEWRTIFEESDPRPCLLHDDTGTCVVLPGAAKPLMGTVKERWNPGALFGGDVPEPLAHVPSGFFSRDRRYCEERLEPGAGYAIGRFTTTNGDSGDQRVDDLLALWRGWRTDYMGELGGRPDRQRPNPRRRASLEADVAPAAAARWVGENGLAEAPINVLGPTDEPRRPFMVGRGEEESIAGRLRWTWLGCSLGFLISGTGLAFVLAGRAGVLG